MPYRQDQDGRWHVEVCVNRRRVHRRLPPGATKGDAKRLDAELTTALARRRDPLIPGDPPLSDVMAAYVASANALASPETARYHALRLGPWIDGHRASQARQVAAKFVRDCLGKYADATINRSLSALRHALTIAFDDGRTAEHFGLAIHRLPEKNARTTFLTLEQVQRLADSASESMRAYLWIAVLTGLRRREIISLRQEDIADDSLMVRAANAKSRRMRTVPIIPSSRPWLAMVPLKLTAEGVKSGFRRAREAAKMQHIQFRDLRRSCGSLLVQQGVDVFVVSRILGHSSVRVTEQHYAHLQMSQMRAGLEKLDDLHRDLHRDEEKAA